MNYPVSNESSFYVKQLHIISQERKAIFGIHQLYIQSPATAQRQLSHTFIKSLQNGRLTYSPFACFSPLICTLQRSVFTSKSIMNAYKFSFLGIVNTITQSQMIEGNILSHLQKNIIKNIQIVVSHPFNQKQSSLSLFLASFIASSRLKIWSFSMVLIGVRKFTFLQQYNSKVFFLLDFSKGIIFFASKLFQFPEYIILSTFLFIFLLLSHIFYTISDFSLMKILQYFYSPRDCEILFLFQSLIKSADFSCALNQQISLGFFIRNVLEGLISFLVKELERISSCSISHILVSVFSMLILFLEGQVLTRVCLFPFEKLLIAIIEALFGKSGVCLVQSPISRLDAENNLCFLTRLFTLFFLLDLDVVFDRGFCPLTLYCLKNLLEYYFMGTIFLKEL